MNLDGRYAYCSYYNRETGVHSERNGGRAQSQPQPSSYALAFFEYKGEGSEYAAKHCECGYFEVAHNPGTGRGCEKFVSKGTQEFDAYYCGCFGWD